MDVEVKSPDFSNDILFRHIYKFLHLGDRNSQEDELKKRKLDYFLLSSYWLLSSRKSVHENEKNNLIEKNLASEGKNTTKE